MSGGCAVTLSGADVGVAGELATDGGVGAGVGEVGAEGVTKHVLVPTSAQACLCRPDRYAEVGAKVFARWGVSTAPSTTVTSAPALSRGVPPS